MCRFSLSCRANQSSKTQAGRQPKQSGRQCNAVSVQAADNSQTRGHCDSKQRPVHHHLWGINRVDHVRVSTHLYHLRQGYSSIDSHARHSWRASLYCALSAPQDETTGSWSRLIRVCAICRRRLDFRLGNEMLGHHSTTRLAAHALVSTPELTALGVELLAEGTGMGWPLALAERTTSSLSMSSRVERVSSSTSAEVRSLVGMGSRTGTQCQYASRAMSRELERGKDVPATYL